MFGHLSTSATSGPVLLPFGEIIYYNICIIIVIAVNSYASILFYEIIIFIM